MGKLDDKVSKPILARSRALFLKQQAAMKAMEAKGWILCPTCKKNWVKKGSRPCAVCQGLEANGLCLCPTCREIPVRKGEICFYCKRKKTES